MLTRETACWYTSWYMHKSRDRLTFTASWILKLIGSGYRTGRRMCELTGLDRGTVYPILRRLQQAGFITPEEQPPRTSASDTSAARQGYRVTQLGSSVLRQHELSYPILRWGPGTVLTQGPEEVSKVYISTDTGDQFFKEERTVLTLSGDRQTTVRIRELDCGCPLEEPQAIVVIRGNIYCSNCVNRCPACDQWIRPGDGEVIQNAWYHQACAADAKTPTETREGLNLDRAEATGKLRTLRLTQIAAAVNRSEMKKEEATVEAPSKAAPIETASEVYPAQSKGTLDLRHGKLSVAIDHIQEGPTVVLHAEFRPGKPNSLAEFADGLSGFLEESTLQKLRNEKGEAEEERKHP